MQIKCWGWGCSEKGMQNCVSVDGIHFVCMRNKPGHFFHLFFSFFHFFNSNQLSIRSLLPKFDLVCSYHFTLSGFINNSLQLHIRITLCTMILLSDKLLIYAMTYNSRPSDFDTRLQWRLPPPARFLHISSSSSIQQLSHTRTKYASFAVCRRPLSWAQHKTNTHVPRRNNATQNSPISNHDKCRQVLYPRPALMQRMYVCCMLRTIELCGTRACATHSSTD